MRNRYSERSGAGSHDRCPDQSNGESGIKMAVFEVFHMDQGLAYG